jgi:hypothetical protein
VPDLAPDGDPGYVNLHFGGPRGIRGRPDRVFTAGVPNDSFGLDVAGADLNGDGYADVVIGAPLDDPDGRADAGSVRVYLGGPSGPATDPALVLVGDAPAEHFGARIANAGDVDGDGYPELLVGATGAGGNGEASLYRGGPGRPGLAVRPTQIFRGDRPDDAFGRTVVGLGDANGDGYGDFAVGSPRANRGSLRLAGMVRLYLGGPALAEGIPVEPQRVFRGGDDGGEFAKDGSSGDYDGDGLMDAVFGEPGAETGRIYIYRGRPSGFPADATRVLLVSSTATLGAAIACAGPHRSTTSHRPEKWPENC